MWRDQCTSADAFNLDTFNSWREPHETAADEIGGMAQNNLMERPVGHRGVSGWAAPGRENGGLVSNSARRFLDAPGSGNVARAGGGTNAG